MDYRDRIAELELQNARQEVTINKLEKEKMEVVHNLVQEVHHTAKSKGWWDRKDPWAKTAIYETLPTLMPEDHKHDIADKIYEKLEAKGLINTGIRSLPELICLMHSELSEALEAVRKGEGAYYIGEGGKPEGWATELADCVIRIFDTFGHYGIDADQVIRAKLDYNKTRSHRHGGKAL